MKNKLFAAIGALLCLTMASCAFNSASDSGQESDIVIKSKDLDSTYYCKLFYQVKDDTISRLSYKFEETNGLNMEIINNFIDHFYVEGEENTDTCSADGKNTCKYNYFVPDFQIQLEEMKQCIIAVSEDCSLDSLKGITCHLSDFCDIAIEVNTSLAKKEKTSNKDVSQAISRTSLKKDLNSILRQFRLEVDSIWSVDNLASGDKADFCHKTLTSPDKDIPSRMIDSWLRISIRKDNKAAIINL